MTYQDVSETFVINSQFRQLISNNSSIIVGPRGCGKTTLLKMLYPISYNSAKSNDLKDLYSKMPFWGIYIAADTEWKEQLDVVRKSGKKEAGDLVITLITINILVSISTCFLDLLDISREHAKSKNNNEELKNIDDIEVKLSKELIQCWRIQSNIAPTLYNIIQYWNILTYDIGNEYCSQKYDGPIFNNYAYFSNYANSAFTAFKHCCKKLDYCSLKKFKWALCFDELEILPDDFRKYIYKLLRSTHQNILFKTTSAYLLSELPEHDTEASEGEDYKEIFNWVDGDEKRKTEWRKFCKALYINNFKSNFHQLVGDFDLIKGIYPSQYNGQDFISGSPTYNIFVDLAKKDPSFSTLLKQKNINPNNPYSEDAIEWLKKIKTTALCRWYHSTARKLSPFYFGEDLLYDFSEGNPRLANNIFNDIYLDAKNQNLDKISFMRQSEILYKLAEKKKKYFENYPNAFVEIGQNRFHLKELINKIGIFFSKDLYEQPFQEFPKNTFIVDNKCENIKPLINVGLELGAFVLLKSDNNEQIYKLSYILYPCFSLPKRKTITKAVSLFDILHPEEDKNQYKLELS